jgi:hypothetical protein
MDVREKLVELLSQAQYLGGLEEKIADHLIANGVTFATYNNIGGKLFAPQLMPMGAITYAIACSHCKNRDADAKKCKQCKCEVKSWFELDTATVQKWIPVSEKLPEKFKAVLGYDPDKGRDILWYNENGFNIVDEYGYAYPTKGVTHWMPLPEPPKGK